jgi:ribulose-5-phosphate 4-epimerase/fuculose-1-phosphate aldolase
MNTMVMDKTADKSRIGKMSDVEAQMRRDLAACYRLVALYGWDDMLATHISARLPDEDGKECFLLNPLGLMFEEITASSLVKINMDGEIISDTPYKVNRAGFVIHSAVHAARHDAGCVIHLHSLDGVAVSAMEDGILPLNQTAITIASHVAFHDYEGVATNEDERARLAADLGNKPLMLLRNHGTLAVGPSIAGAFVLMYLLETCCTVQVRTLGMGQKLHAADPKVIAETGKMMNDFNFASYAEAMAWPALLRKLDRENPGYAD